MRKRSFNITAIIVAFCVTFSGLPLMGGTLDVSAATTFFKNMSATATGQTTTRLSWKKLTKKQQKKINGIAVFRDGKPVKRLKKGAVSFNDSGLKAGTSYSYQLMTFKTKIVKKWYNKSTGQWQKKKPKKKDRGGSKKETTYTYKKTSSLARVTTQSEPASTASAPTQYTVTWKNYDGTILSTESYGAGTLPTYKGNVPVRPDSEYYTFTFSKWDPAITAVKTNVTYTAKFTAAGKQNSDTTTGGNTTASTPSSGSTANKKTVTDYLGKTRTLTQKTTSTSTFWLTEDGTMVTDANMPRYDRTANGSFENAGTKYFQYNGATFSKTDISNAKIGSDYSCSFEMYNVDKSKLVFSLDAGTTIKPVNTYTYDGYSQTPVVRYFFVQNGKRMAQTNDSGDPVSFKTQGAATIAKYTIYRDCDGICGAGDALGLFNGNIAVTVKYDGVSVGSFTVSSSRTEIVDGMSTRRRLALDIASDAISKKGGSSGNLSTDLEMISTYIGETYKYNQSVSGYGWTDTCQCTFATYVLETWAIYRYGDKGLGFAGSGASSSDNHRAFHLNSDPNRYYEVYFAD